MTPTFKVSLPEGEMMARSSRELDEALAEQISALVASSRAFDAGEHWEAKRLATITYTLVHDGGRNSQSLLRQASKKDILFTSTCRGVNDSNLLADEPLTMLRLTGEGATPLPIKGECRDMPGGYRLLKFGKWWDEAVFKDTGKRRLSRKNLVFSLRNQEGGSHFDPTLKDEVYRGYKEGRGSGWTFTDGKGGETFVEGGPLATMRQIAWELADTFLSNGIGDPGRLRSTL